MNCVRESKNGYAVEKKLIDYIRINLQTMFPSEDIEVEYIDDFYDFHIKHNQKVIKKVEVKSCQFLINNGSRRFGRFDFTNAKNSTRQRTNNIEVCFCVCIGENFEILGFLNAKTLGIKRYISHPVLQKTRKLRTEKNFFNRLSIKIREKITDNKE